MNDTTNSLEHSNSGGSGSSVVMAAMFEQREAEYKTKVVELENKVVELSSSLRAANEENKRLHRQLLHAVQPREDDFNRESFSLTY